MGYSIEKAASDGRLLQIGVDEAIFARMGRYLSLLLLSVFLAGCTQTVQEMGYSQRKALAQEIVQRCYAQGIKSGTPEMRECTKVEAQAEIARRNRQAHVEDARRSSDSGPRVCNRVGYTVICS
jgi:hypothetical protein